MFRHRHKRNFEAELDITSFMNLMIILVPVLLMSMVFSHVTVLELTLPDSALSDSSNPDEPKLLEVVLRDDYLDVNYPAGIRVKRIEKIAAPIEDENNIAPVDGADSGTTTELVHNFELLSLTLQELKRQLKEKGIEKRDILLLSQPNTDYQTIISAMDTVRSFKAVVVADVVDAELFPAISLGDAPVAAEGGAQ
ncbi:biopolymer transporter ExbD [Marinibactrum halimedae]|uniref:Biopolymer transporter ExbD n=1 Tax=Marinibactrum halimedae TaxID=1444977 RepID=A0AA37TDA1_9GAMM|nr:biopolymer transporter ExbD [Marinibactrum halimedae]MCD9458271.1 biopolymer transporter ExbD [Marinibactrum halimedae]GLS27102.1 hypothetical protein GCM10007877_28210 [Marinibactrum halimedae]